MADDEIVQLIPFFACLADAGMELMDAISINLRKKPTVGIPELSQRSDIQTHCQQLIAASKVWATTTAMIWPSWLSANG